MGQFSVEISPESGSVLSATQHDNNIAENAMRCVALGRKNYLFAGSDSGGEKAASIYTIVRTAKRNSLNPETYLWETLMRIADGHPINRINELMPF